MSSSQTLRPGRRYVAGFFFAAAVAAGAAGAWGDDARPAPSAAELIKALQSKGAARGAAAPAAHADLIKSLKEKTARGLSISDDERSRLAEVTKVMPAYDMDIPFDLNSAAITDRARPAIKALGEALLDKRLLGASFVVAGHTDASGAAKVNQRLSEKRAQAVKEVLVSEYHLTGDQLIAVGYGPQQPKLPEKPFAGENRRVQIVNVGE